MSITSPKFWRVLNILSIVLTMTGGTVAAVSCASYFVLFDSNDLNPGQICITIGQAGLAGLNFYLFLRGFRIHKEINSQIYEEKRIKESGKILYYRGKLYDYGNTKRNSS